MYTHWDENKFRELVLYVSEKCESDPNFGAVKLNKILFLADFVAYAELGKPISGAEYVALEFGPAPRLLKPIRDEMADRKDIVVKRQQRFGYQQDRVIPLRKANLSLFSGGEISLVDDMISICSEETGRDLTELTHMMCGWQVASNREVIPYETIYLSSDFDEATRVDRERARELAVIYGW